jgi:hypothetical protein
MNWIPQDLGTKNICIGTLEEYSWLGFSWTSPKIRLIDYCQWIRIEDSSRRNKVIHVRVYLHNKLHVEGKTPFSSYLEAGVNVFSLQKDVSQILAQKTFTGIHKINK